MNAPSPHGRRFNISVMVCGVMLVCWQSAVGQPGTQIWNLPVDAPILSSPAIGSDGTIYVGTYDRKLEAVTATGDSAWSFALPSAGFTGIYSSPAIGSDGTIYFGGEDGTLYALNPDGTTKWTFDTGTSIYSSPAIGSDGTVYFGSYKLQKNGTAYLYAVTNGTLRWSVTLTDSTFSSPVIALDGTIYVGCDDGKLFAVTNGAVKWAFTTGTKAITASPSIGADGKVYVGVGSVTNPRFYSVNTNGTTNWIFTAASRIRSSAAISYDGTIYFGCDDTNLYALKPNGTLKWSATLGGAVGSSPAIAGDGTIYVGCDDQKLYAFDSNGSNLWSFTTSAKVFSSPAIAANGTVVVACGASGGSVGYLYAVLGAAGPATTPWPMFRHDAKHTARFAIDPNTSPVVPALSASTDLNTPLTISTNRLLRNATDAEGDALTPTGASSTNGGTVIISGGVLTYRPLTNYSGADRIDFTVSDSHNGATGYVFVTVRPANTQSLNILGVVNNGGSTVTITFAGIPNRYYVVESTTNLSAPVPPMWVKIRTNQAGANGIWSLTDTVVPGSRFYRSTGGSLSAP